ncbi:hypothetical protein OXX80_014322, partial [Metschnikowia pulcherrima]
METGLPAGWSIKLSKTHNEPYFLNAATRESSWEPPYGSDGEKVSSYIAKFKETAQPVVAATA